jgi:Lysyl oxidase
MRAITKLTVAAGALMVLVSAPSAQAASSMLLPDLRQAPVGCAGGFHGSPANCDDWDVCMVADVSNPNAECVKTGSVKAVRLRFTTVEENIGDGPLLFYGHRDSRAQATMTVRQAFQVGDHGAIPDSFAATQQASRTSMYYEPAPAHMHWHLLNFARFELRDQAGGTLVTDRKNGFCLGDRYEITDSYSLSHRVRKDDSTESKLHEFLVNNMCAHHNPDAMDVTEGISVGSGDDYTYDVDFQWLDITGVPSGVYTVVNTVNPDRTLIEKDYSNDSSSIAISVQWPEHAKQAPSTITAPPVVRLLRSCPGTDRCQG